MEEQQTPQYKPIKIESLSKTGLKASQEKNIRKQILESIPILENGLLDRIWPKKANFQMAKQKPHNIVYFINNEPCFLQPKEGPIIPHIKLLHKYPCLLPMCQVDKGGIKHVISGANIMIPGMTSKGGKLPQGKIHGGVVAVYCEGKENALAIGKMTMGVADMVRIGKGIGIEVLTYVGDDSWNVK